MVHENSIGFRLLCMQIVNMGNGTVTAILLARAPGCHCARADIRASMISLFFIA